MQVLVVGAGLAGLTLAHALVEQGVRVTVLERREGPGLETSARNGSLQHPSHAEPWNAPGVVGPLLRSLGREDAALLLRLRAVPGLIGWGWQFLRRANAASYGAATRANLRLAQFSLEQMAHLRGLGLRYHARPAGTLVLMRDADALARATDWAQQLERDGLAFEALGLDAIVAHEPALQPVAATLAGALHYPGDERGDPAALCAALADSLQARGATLRWRADVQALRAVSGRVQGVRLAGGETLDADSVVLAAASHSVALAQPLGLRLPVRPVKGYSLTLPVLSAAQRAAAPRHAMIDADAHVAVVPVADDRVRIAGTAEFTGHDLTLTPGRLQMLRQRLAALLPAYAAAVPQAAIEPWAGLRPMCSDGICLAGPTRVPGLWLHTGHGQLGFTVAAGSARLVADRLLGRTPALDASAYAPARHGL